MIEKQKRTSKAFGPLFFVFNLKLCRLQYEDLKKVNTEAILKEEPIKGYSSLFLSALENKILVNQLDHTTQLYCTDFIEKDPPKSFRGHKCSLYVRSVLSPCTNFIASGSTDQGIHIWDTTANTLLTNPLISLYAGHYAEVNKTFILNLIS